MITATKVFATGFFFSTPIIKADGPPYDYTMIVQGGSGASYVIDWLERFSLA
jgi:hypothetical protein